MARAVTHKSIVKFHEDIAKFHKEINGFCRFNFSEFTGKFRAGVETPALLLESHSSQMERNPIKTTFNNRDISFLVIDFTGKADDYDKQEEVLDQTECICLDIATYLETQSQIRDSWLYGLYDANSLRIEKVGPLWDQMYGWNVLYTVKNLESMRLDPEKWDFTTP